MQGLTGPIDSVTMFRANTMHLKRLLAILAAAAFMGAMPVPARQEAKRPSDQGPSPTSKRLTVEVSGGEKNVAVENASVYLKFVEVKKIGRDKKYELDVKTNREGVAHIPDPPTGRVLIQIVAEGWKTYGKYYQLPEDGPMIKIHLDRPPKWY